MEQWMACRCLNQDGSGIQGAGTAPDPAAALQNMSPNVGGAPCAAIPPVPAAALRKMSPNVGGAPCAAIPPVPAAAFQNMSPNVGGAPCAATAFGPHLPPPLPNPSGYPGLPPSPNDPHSAHLRAFRRMAGGGTFLVTKCLEPRRPLLGPAAAIAMAETICHEANCSRVLLAAFVVMPDHWHAVVGILPGDSLSTRMGVIGKWVSQKTARDLASTGVHWQDGYHDTRIRSSEQFSFSVDYAQNNPVRGQLVERAEDWPHSSLNPLYAEAILKPWPWRFEHDG